MYYSLYSTSFNDQLKKIREWEDLIDNVFDFKTVLGDWTNWKSMNWTKPKFLSLLNQRNNFLSSAQVV
jgi:hypothetical protein